MNLRKPDERTVRNVLGWLDIAISDWSMMRGWENDVKMARKAASVIRVYYKRERYMKFGKDGGR